MEPWLSGLLAGDMETTTTTTTVDEEDEKRPWHFLPPPLKSQPYPWLITSHGRYYQTQTFFNVSKLHQYHTRIIPEMRNRRIFHASFGWLVLMSRDSISDFLLLNLTSMETIQIPDPLDVEYSNMCILTAPPMDPNCRIIFNDPLSKDFLFCRPGIDSEYTRQKISKEVFGFVISSITIGGNTFCWTSLGKLLTIEFEESNLKFCQVMVRNKPRKTFCLSQDLVEFHGELLLVRKLMSRVTFCEWPSTFEIYKLDSCAMEWVEMKSIGDNAIFPQTMNIMIMVYVAP
ncbi:hypothetical protein COLO4_37147 [Corchorus olitorius]|uniref:KIB1-4 beta-propeller domain-containing protein n=1 Tax=Corchorus olitorius TaxID=93759 RepID=A0A1R3G344_9ROSI|nr:hypothetical protein COLO4_37147 [Corchorus olitorius]